MSTLARPLAAALLTLIATTTLFAAAIDPTALA